jgi:hypothetical protein
VEQLLRARDESWLQVLVEEDCKAKVGDKYQETERFGIETFPRKQIPLPATLLLESTNHNQDNPDNPDTRIYAHIDTNYHSLNVLDRSSRLSPENSPTTSISRGPEALPVSTPASSIIENSQAQLPLSIQRDKLTNKLASQPEQRNAGESDAGSESRYPISPISPASNLSVPVVVQSLAYWEKSSDTRPLRDCEETFGTPKPSNSPTAAQDIIPPAWALRVISTKPMPYVWLTAHNDRSLLNVFKSFIEDQTAPVPWTWWPLIPRMRHLEPGHVRMHWRPGCACQVADSWWRRHNFDVSSYLTYARLHCSNVPTIFALCFCLICINTIMLQQASI